MRLLFMSAVIFGVFCTAERVSPKLVVTLKGTVLSWHLLLNQSNTVTGYYIQVYAKDLENTETHTEWTTDTTYDLQALQLPQGLYYVMVLSVTEVGSGPFSEPIVYTVEGNGSHPKASTMAVVAISCVLALAIVLGSLLFAWTMCKLKARQSSPNLTLEMTASHVQTCRDVSLAEDTPTSSTPALHKLSRDHIYECVNNNNKTMDLNNDPMSKTSDQAISSATNAADDLPYGYISPLDINTPQSKGALRSGNKYTTVESQLPPSGPSSVLSTSEHSQNDYLKLLHR